MKKISTIFLQAVIVLVGIVALFLLIWLPQTEGRAVNLDLISIYTDPFILYGYGMSVVFFIAMYNAFRLLGYIRQGIIFTTKAVNIVRNIKLCAVVIAVLVVFSALYIKIFHNPADDPAGFMSLSALIILASAVIATVAAIFQNLLQKAVKMKSENDLTV